MAKERKRLINEDMVSEIPPPMVHSVPSVTASVHHRRLGMLENKLKYEGTLFYHRIIAIYVLKVSTLFFFFYLSKEVDFT